MQPTVKIGDSVYFWPEDMAHPLAAIVLLVVDTGLVLRVMSPSGSGYDCTVERVPHGAPGRIGVLDATAALAVRGHWTERG